MKHYNKIVAHIPHSSILRYMDNWVGSFNMFPNVKRLTDWHTDLLFASNSANVKCMVFPYSRFFLDVERLKEDPMEEIGQGKIYKNYNGYTRSLSNKDIEALELQYDQWHSLCANEIIENTLVIDCHSFPSDICSDVDVCIGFNDDETTPQQETIDMIMNEFSKYGFRVKCNSPYSNSIVFGKHDSIMIEIRKGLYMNENTLELWKNNSVKVRNAILNIYNKTLNNE